MVNVITAAKMQTVRKESAHAKKDLLVMGSSAKLTLVYSVMKMLHVSLEDVCANWDTSEMEYSVQNLMITVADAVRMPIVCKDFASASQVTMEMGMIAGLTQIQLYSMT